MPRQRPSLGFAARLGLATSGLIVLVCVAQSWLLARRGLEHLGGYLTQRGDGIAAYLAGQARMPLAAAQLEPLRQLAAQARAESGVVYTRFFDAQGLLLVGGGTPPAITTPPAAHPGGGPLVVAPDVWEFRAPVTTWSDGTSAARPLGTVAVGISVEALHALRRRVVTTAAVLTSLFVLAAVLAALALARAITRPLEALATATEAIARGEFDTLVAIHTRDEIGRLAQSFNAMTASLARSRATLEHQVEELRRANHLKSEFVATVSHELRTPLNVILGYAEMLREGAGGPLTHGQAELLAGIQRYAHLQRDLVTSVLDFSRLSAGGVPVKVESVDLPVLLTEIQATYAERVRDPGVRLLVTVHADVAPVETDREKLTDVLRHLVDNAVKFTDRGTITLAARPSPLDGRVILEVTDTGCGIAEHALPHLFEPFLQIGPSSTRPTGGVGLGLSIVRYLVEALGGTVTVTSREGEGSTFRVDLPVRPTPTADLPAAATALDETARNAAVMPVRAQALRAGTPSRRGGDAG